MTSERITPSSCQRRSSLLLLFSASRIDRNIGILGADYPGYFDIGNTKLARLLTYLETSTEYFPELRNRGLRSWPHSLIPIGTSLGGVDKRIIPDKVRLIFRYRPLIGIRS